MFWNCEFFFTEIIIHSLLPTLSVLFTGLRHRIKNISANTSDNIIFKVFFFYFFLFVKTQQNSKTNIIQAAAPVFFLDFSFVVAVVGRISNVCLLMLRRCCYC